MFGLQDTPRRGAENLIRRLHARGVRTIMLTGDSRIVADAVGRQLGVTETIAELLPEQKVSAIERLQAGGARVAMVGDGINDAPALAQANVGIALGAGTDAAIESAGVILVGDHIDDVAGALDLGKASYRTMTGNVVVAVLFNIVGMALAALGFITPLFAILFMIVSIFAILLNTLQVRWMSLERQAVKASPGALEEREYRISNMVCEGCATKIQDALSKLHGVREVTPRVAQKQVAVRFQPGRVSDETIREELRKAGFSAIEA